MSGASIKAKTKAVDDLPLASAYPLPQAEAGKQVLIETKTIQKDEGKSLSPVAPMIMKEEQSE